jgi:hypothetical protein
VTEKYDRQQRTEPEVRHRNADQRERGGSVVDRRARSHGRQDAQRDGNDQRDDHRRSGELECRRHAFSNDRRHRLIGPQRRAQVANRGVPHEVHVLRVQRTIQTERAS